MKTQTKTSLEELAKQVSTKADEIVDEAKKSIQTLQDKRDERNEASKSVDTRVAELDDAVGTLTDTMLVIVNKQAEVSGTLDSVNDTLKSINEKLSGAAPAAVETPEEPDAVTKALKDAGLNPADFTVTKNGMKKSAVTDDSAPEGDGNAEVASITKGAGDMPDFANMSKEDVDTWLKSLPAADRTKVRQYLLNKNLLAKVQK